MEAPGTAEIDVQFGAMQSDTARFIVPDIEVDLGLFPGVEIDVDGAYAIEGPDNGRFAFDHPAPDNIWVAAKLGLYDSRNEGETSAWALGAQLGPKFPTARDLTGSVTRASRIGPRLGRQPLRREHRWSARSGPEIWRNRTIGIEGGLDAEFDLGRWGLSVTGELGGVRYFSADPHELHATAGINWGVNDLLDSRSSGLSAFYRAAITKVCFSASHPRSSCGSKKGNRQRRRGEDFLFLSNQNSWLLLAPCSFFSLRETDSNESARSPSVGCNERG